LVRLISISGYVEETGGERGREGEEEEEGEGEEDGEGEGEEVEGGDIGGIPKFSKSAL